MRFIGVLALMCGAIVLFIGFGSDTSLPISDGSRVHNIGLLNEKQNTIIIGSALVIIGAIVSSIAVKSDKSKMQVSDDKNCPYCAETIKMDAIICRFCNRKLDHSRKLDEFGEKGTKSAIKDDALEFCFHCGESVKGREKKCSSCGGLL